MKTEPGTARRRENTMVAIDNRPMTTALTKSLFGVDSRSSSPVISSCGSPRGSDFPLVTIVDR